MVERLLEQLKRELGIVDPLVQMDDGAYVLDFEPDLHIAVYAHGDECIRLFAKLAPLPKENKEEFFRICMTGNLLGRETGGAALGIDDSEQNLCLAYSLPVQVSYRDFRDAFEDFLNYADAWRQEALVFSEVNNGNG